MCLQVKHTAPLKLNMWTQQMRKNMPSRAALQHPFDKIRQMNKIWSHTRSVQVQPSLNTVQSVRGRSHCTPQPAVQLLRRSPRTQEIFPGSRQTCPRYWQVVSLPASYTSIRAERQCGAYCIVFWGFFKHSFYPCSKCIVNKWIFPLTYFMSPYI